MSDRLNAGKRVINLHALARLAYDVALNTIIVYWFGQLAAPSLGLHPPTILGAIGIAGLVWVLRRPLRVPVGLWG